MWVIGKFSKFNTEIDIIRVKLYFEEYAILCSLQG